MKYIFNWILIVLSSTPLFAQRYEYDIRNYYPIEASHSYVGFNVKYMGFAMVRGRFAGFNGTVYYDAKNLEKTSVTVSIDVSTIDTDNDWRDNDLKSANWFDVEKFPKMQFQSTSAIETSNGLIIEGLLTIKDVTKSVTLNMSKGSGVLKDVRGDAQIIFTGNLTIDRTEYNVAGERWSQLKEGITAVENEVQIELSILGKQIKEANFRNWVRNPESPQGKIFQAIKSDGIDKGLELFESMLANDSLEINTSALNIVGYMLLKSEDIDAAITVFEKNKETFPEEANVYDSLAEAWYYKDPRKAKEFYKRALELNPDNTNAREILRHLQ